jgi:hypothetical protein
VRDDVLRELVKMHRASYRGSVTRCRECGREWPCDTALVLQRLALARS